MSKEGEFIVKGTEKQMQFETGSVRSSSEGRGRYDLIPPMPLRRLAIHYENGAKRYSERNWEKGQNLSRYTNSMERHMNNLKAGEPLEDHCAAICWNAFAYMWTLNEIEAGRLPKSLDDRPKPEPQYDPALQVQLPVTVTATLPALPGVIGKGAGGNRGPLFGPGMPIVDPIPMTVTPVWENCPMSQPLPSMSDGAFEVPPK